MRFLFNHSTRHPSAILFLVQILGVLLYPFMEEARYGQLALNIFGMLVLVITTRMVRRTPGLTVMYLAAVVTRLIAFTTQTRE